MGDEQQRELARPLQLEQDLEDLRAHQDVEHRDRLVADDPVGLEHERGGDRDALALAAGELLRVALDEALGRQPTSSSDAPDPRLGARPRRCR